MLKNFTPCVQVMEGWCVLFSGLIRYPWPYEHKPMLIIVCNLLTRELKTLPPGSFLNSHRPRMVQFVMDRATNCYQVIVVGDRAGGIGVEIYNSATGAWSSRYSLSDPIFGYQYRWEGGGQRVLSEGTRLGPCAFDCRDGRLSELGDHYYPCKGASVKDYALVGDHLFVLHEEVYEEARFGGMVVHYSRYIISEYQGHKHSTGLNWVKLRVHRCGSDFEAPPSPGSYSMRFRACEGFFLVLANNNELHGYNHELAWLYDISMEKWHMISEMPLEKVESFVSDTMFELQWAAVP